MSKTELVSRGFHSTSDFPLLFSNLAGKTLDAAYQEEPHTWRPIARQRNLPDFKNANDLIVAGALTPEALLEGGEYKAGTLQEAQHTWKLATYARKVTLTRQSIINDDLSALERVPEMLGRGFRRLESNIIWALITGNSATSVDGLSLFNSAHNNSSAQTITTTGFNAAKKAMRKQTDIAGNTINLSPSYMMVPTDLESSALQFLFPTGFAPAARTGDAGPVSVQTAGIELIVEPRLDGSATTWYLAASPGAVEGIVYGYLAGEEGPTVTTTEKRDPDGVELLARFDFGAAVKDYRGFFRAAAAS
jgi:phage major head subunit gpT-like protein